MRGTQTACAVVLAVFLLASVRAADLYVHPTLNDSFGMAPLEAMSFGLPVILSPAPWCGFAQYVKAGEEALVLSHPEQADEDRPERCDGTPEGLRQDDLAQ